MRKNLSIANDEVTKYYDMDLSNTLSNVKLLGTDSEHGDVSGNSQWNKGQVDRHNLSWSLNQITYLPSSTTLLIDFISFGRRRSASVHVSFIFDNIHIT